jgi:hypothetical protein
VPCLIVSSEPTTTHDKPPTAPRPPQRQAWKILSKPWNKDGCISCQKLGTRGHARTRRYLGKAIQRAPMRDSFQMNAASRRDDVDRAIRKLTSLYESGLGIVEIVACGASAIPALREKLLEREPSGLFEVRRRVVDALSSLGAYDVLIEYLSAEQQVTDPVERLGDDAVVNYAAWAVARTRNENVFALLLRLARRPSLSGVIGALGTFGRTEAIPALIGALEEDGSRNVAVYMVRRMGQSARADLLVSAKQRLPSPDRESESSLRRRRSSLMLLTEVGLSSGSWPQIRCLMHDDDEAIVLLACKLCLVHSPEERRDAISRLASLLPSADWMLRDEIERCLSGARPRDEYSPPVRKDLH